MDLSGLLETFFIQTNLGAIDWFSENILEVYEKINSKLSQDPIFGLVRECWLLSSAVIIDNKLYIVNIQYIWLVQFQVRVLQYALREIQNSKSFSSFPIFSLSMAYLHCLPFWPRKLNSSSWKARPFVKIYESEASFLLFFLYSSFHSN